MSKETVLLTPQQITDAAEKHANNVPGAWISPKHFLELKQAYMAGMQAGIDIADEMITTKLELNKFRNSKDED